MTTAANINVFEICGPVAVDEAPGASLHQMLEGLLSQSENRVTVDFEGVRFYGTPFLNAAFGRLLEKFDESDISARLNLKDITPQGYECLKNVIDVSRDYYRGDPEFKKAVDAVADSRACLSG